MQNANEFTLNSPIELEDTTSPKFNFGYWIIVFFSVVMVVFVAAQIFNLVEKDETALIGNSLKTVVGIVRFAGKSSNATAETLPLQANKAKARRFTLISRSHRRK